MVTGYEKRVTYNSAHRKRSNRDELALNGKQASIDSQEVLAMCLIELFPYDQTSNSDLYFQQLNRLKEVITQKHISIVI